MTSNMVTMICNDDLLVGFEGEWRTRTYRYDHGDDGHDDVGNGRDYGVDAAADSRDDGTLVLKISDNEQPRLRIGRTMVYRGLVRKGSACVGCACVWYACVDGIWEKSTRDAVLIWARG